MPSSDLATFAACFLPSSSRSWTMTTSAPRSAFEDSSPFAGAHRVTGRDLAGDLERVHVLLTLDDVDRAPGLDRLEQTR